MRDDVRRERRAEAGNVGEQLFAGGVQFHANAVHATNDNVVEAALERALLHVVLILTDTDGFRIELHEFRKRVHEAATDRNCAAHGHVVIWKLFPRDFRSRID